MENISAPKPLTRTECFTCTRVFTLRAIVGEDWIHLEFCVHLSRRQPVRNTGVLRVILRRIGLDATRRRKFNHIITVCDPCYRRGTAIMYAYGLYKVVDDNSDDEKENESVLIFPYTCFSTTALQRVWYVFHIKHSVWHSVARIIKRIGMEKKSADLVFNAWQNNCASTKSVIITKNYT